MIYVFNKEDIIILVFILANFIFVLSVNEESAVFLKNINVITKCIAQSTYFDIIFSAITNNAIAESRFFVGGQKVIILSNAEFICHGHDDMIATSRLPIKSFE